MSGPTVGMKSDAKPTVRRFRTGRALLKFALWSCGLVLAMAVCMAVAIGALNATNSGVHPDQIAKALADAMPYAALVHILLIALLWWQWPTFVERCFRTGRMTPTMRQVALASRNRTILLLVCFELVVVMEFPFSLIRLFQHG